MQLYHLATVRVSERQIFYVPTRFTDSSARFPEAVAFNTAGANPAENSRDVRKNFYYSDAVRYKPLLFASAL